MIGIILSSGFCLMGLALTLLCLCPSRYDGTRMVRAVSFLASCLLLSCGFLRIAVPGSTLLFVCFDCALYGVILGSAYRIIEVFRPVER